MVWFAHGRHRRDPRHRLREHLGLFSSRMLPVCYYGEYGVRAQAAEAEDDLDDADDDEELAKTPGDVVDMLGFDPADGDGDDAEA